MTTKIKRMRMSSGSGISTGSASGKISTGSASSKKSSIVANSANLIGLPLLSGSSYTFKPEEFQDMKDYCLMHLLPKLSLLEKAKSSEELCLLFFEEVVRKMKDVKMKEVKITVRKKVHKFKKLYPLYVTTDQRPDLNVFRETDDLPLILVEVHSSPFAATVNKTILGVTDQLRLYRTYDARCTRCVGFAFPRKDVMQCVVLVSVTWEKLRFRYTLKPIQFESVRGTIEQELRAATESAPSTSKQELRFLVPLSQEDLGLFGANGSPVQLPSRASILVRHGMDYFKSPALLEEADKLKSLILSVIPRGLPTIILQKVEVGGTDYYKYRGIPKDPLTCPEAQSCLYDLVPKLVQVIESFHQNGWAHQDIRLENICFDEDCMPVFIDLERCRKSSESSYGGEGCMYSMHGSIETDWLQLGLLVCWVLYPWMGQVEEEKEDYHTRKCEKIFKSLQDPFLKSLIGKGMWVCCAHVVLWVLILVA